MACVYSDFEGKCQYFDDDDIHEESCCYDVKGYCNCEHEIYPQEFCKAFELLLWSDD